MAYIDPQYQIKSFQNNLNVILEYRFTPNKGCEIVDIASLIPGRGEGTLVYKNFEIFLTKNQIKNIYAFTRYSNVKAQKWYKKMGFTSTLIPDFYFDEKDYQAFILTKNLF